MPFEALHNTATRNIPDTDAAIFLRVAHEVLATGTPGDFRLRIAIVGVSVKVAYLLSSIHIHNNVARIIRGQSKELVLPRLQVHDGKRAVLVKGSCSDASRVEIDFSLFEVVACNKSSSAQCERM